MANIKSFPNNRDEYVGAEHAMRWLHGRTSGVFAANNNAAVAAVQNAMAVTVSDGIGWISDSDANGVVWWNDTEKNNGAKMQLTIDAADGVLNRIDRVIVEWKTTDYADLPEIKILKGTPASAAAAPSLTNNTTQRQLSLAQILVAAGTTSITASMITDERQNPDVCGLVTDTLSIDTSVINAQFTELLAQLRAAIEQASGGIIPDNTVTLAKLASDAKYWSELPRTNTSSDATSNYVVSSWGHVFNWVYGSNQSFMFDLNEFNRITDDFWETVIFANNPFTLILQNMPAVIESNKGTSSAAAEIRITVPQYKWIKLKKISNVALIVTGNYDTRMIYAGTAEPSASLGNDGDIYLQYTE
nr:MAG TPA: Receptor Binding Protein [Caudoviricetes sp.]DAM69153.1 MAG TPA: Receptor Binding Protein [Caudoviricetes sp.]